MTGAEVMAVLRELVAAGLDAAAALAALERITVTDRHEIVTDRHVTRDGFRDAAQAQSDAERARNYRQRKRFSRIADVPHEVESVTDHHVTRDDLRDAASPPEVLAPGLHPPHPLTKNPLTPNLQEPPYSPPRRENPVIVLGSILDSFNAKRFADHCAGKGKRLSAEQAEAVVGELRAFRDGGGNPAEAVTLAIGRGWTTIRLDWLAEKPPPAATGRTAQEARIAEELAALERLTGVRNGSARADYGSGGPVVDAVPAGGGRRLG